jgi:hypothetical protein
MQQPRVEGEAAELARQRGDRPKPQAQEEQRKEAVEERRLRGGNRSGIEGYSDVLFIG